jgi:transcription initiation factor IIE alpha subunit
MESIETNIVDFGEEKASIEITILQKKIVDVLTLTGEKGIKRDDLAEKTDIPRSTVYDNLIKLKKKKLVDYKEEKETPGKGRKTRMWYLLGDITI